jgi:hypothetical protein
MSNERTMNPLSDETLRKIQQRAERRPNFVSPRMAAVMEQAAFESCQRVLGRDRVERPAVRFG